MLNFFENKTTQQWVGDIGVGALKGAKYGLATSVVLSATGSGVLTLGSLGLMVGASALGGAITIIPAVIAYKFFINNNVRPNGAFLFNLAKKIFIATAFSLISACIGAAVLGVAIAPVASAACTASLVFGVFSTVGGILTKVYGSSQRVISSEHAIAAGFAFGTCLGTYASFIVTALGTDMLSLGTFIPLTAACAFTGAILNYILFDPSKGQSSLTSELIVRVAHPLIIVGLGSAITGVAGPVTFSAITASLTFWVLDRLSLEIIKACRPTHNIVDHQGYLVDHEHDISANVGF